MQALSRQSEPQKLVRSGWKKIIVKPHLTDTRQKLLTVQAMQSVTLLMHKVWKFITPHIITEHTEDPGALCIPLAYFPLLLFYHFIITVSPSFSLCCQRWWKTGKLIVIIIHLKTLNVSWLGYSNMSRNLVRLEWTNVVINVSSSH